MSSSQSLMITEQKGKSQSLQKSLSLSGRNEDYEKTNYLRKKRSYRIKSLNKLP